MTRKLVPFLLALLSLAPGCYRVVRVRGVYGIARPTPIQSGTYWSSEAGVVVSSGVSASSGIAASVEPTPPESYSSTEVGVTLDGSLDVALASATAAGGASAGASSAAGSLGVGSAPASASSASGASSVVSTGSATSASASGASSAGYGTDLSAAVPALGVAISGAGTSLSAIASIGVAVDCACSLDGEIAALSRLRPLGDGALSASARVGGDANVLIEAELLHEGLPVSGGPSEVIVRVRGGAAPPIAPPLRVHLVIDASTSMERRWDSVKDAAIALIGRLRPEDELQIVVYGHDAQVALPPSRVGDGRRARAVVRGLTVGGRTNIEAGLRAAYSACAPGGGSIVLLLSDGVPLGGAASPDELGALAAEAYAANAATTVAIGLGMEFHAGILRALAEAGHGDFRIAPRMSELPALLDAEIEAHGHIVARDVEIQVMLGEGVTFAEGELAAGLSVVDGGAQILVPALSAGAELTFALRVMVGRAAVGGSVANIACDFTTASSARGHGEEELVVARASGRMPSGSLRASLDLELGAVLELAASAIENGDSERAAGLFDAHAVEVEGAIGVATDARFEERATASHAMALALRTLVPSASWPERRATAASMLEWSIGLGR